MPPSKGISDLWRGLKRPRGQQPYNLKKSRSAGRKVSTKRSQAASTGRFPDESYHQVTTERVVNFPGNLSIEIVQHGTLEIPNKEDFHEVDASHLPKVPGITFYQHGTLPTCNKSGKDLDITAPLVTMVVNEVLEPTSSCPPTQLNDWYVSIVQVLMDCKTRGYYGTALTSDDFYIEHAFTVQLPLIDKITDKKSGLTPSSPDSPSYSKESSSKVDLSDVYAPAKDKEVYGQLYSEDRPVVSCDLVLNKDNEVHGNQLKSSHLNAEAYHLNRVEISETFVTCVCSYQLGKEDVENFCYLGGVEWQFKGRINRLESDYHVDKSCAADPPKIRLTPPTNNENEDVLCKALGHKISSHFATPNETKCRKKVVLVKS